MQIDPKLKKLISKAKPYPGIAPLSQAVRQQFILNAFDGADYLIGAPPGPERISMALSLLTDLANSGYRTWSVAATAGLADRQKDHFQSVLGTRRVAMYADDASSACAIQIWPVARLIDRLADIDSWPHLIMIHDGEFMNHPACGPGLETLFTALPRSVSVVALTTPSNKLSQYRTLLQRMRCRPVEVLGVQSAPVELLPAFLSADGHLTPLVQKKRLTNRVKQIIKDSAPIKHVHAARFIRDLAASLRAESLTPAVVVLPTESDCDAALQGCKPIVEHAGDVLTRPGIAAILGRHPWLKSYPALAASLHCRAAAFHGGHHPLWQTLIPQLLALDCVDIIFATPDILGDLTFPLQTAVWCADNAPAWYLQRGISLLGRKGAFGVAVFALAHTPAVAPAEIKDQLTLDADAAASVLAANPRRALTLSTSTQLALKRLNCTFFMGRYGHTFWEMQDLDAQLAEELPEARCAGGLPVVRSLIHLRLNLSVRRHRIADGAERARPGLQPVAAAVDSAMADLPCEDCPHQGMCHKRGNKQFRHVMERCDELTQKPNAGYLHLAFQAHLDALKDANLVDETQQLTYTGTLALRSGLPYPQPFIQSLNVILQSSADLRLPMAAGFVRPGLNAGGVPRMLAEIYNAILPDLRGLLPAISRARQQMLRFGLPAPAYDPVQAAILAMNLDIDQMQTLSQQTGFCIGALIQLKTRAQRLATVIETHRNTGAAENVAPVITDMAQT